MLVTQGEVKLGQPGSNSPELTQGSSPARPETAEGLGIPPTATKWPGEGIYATGRLVRVEWCTQQRLRWPNLTAVATCTGPEFGSAWNWRCGARWDERVG